MKISFSKFRIKLPHRFSAALKTSFNFLILGAFLTGFIISWMKSDLSSYQNQTEIRGQLHQIDALDAQWSLDIWKIKDNTQITYPEKQSPLEKIYDIKKTLDADFKSLGNEKLVELSNAILPILDGKKQVISDFEEEAFSLKNSLSFIPSESFNLDKTIEDASSTLQTKSSKSDTQQVSIIHFYNEILELNKKLLSTALHFSVIKDNDTKDELNAVLKKIDVAKSALDGVNIDPDIADQLEIVVAHAENIIEQTEFEGKLIEKMEKLNLRDKTKKLDEAILTEYANLADQSAAYFSSMIIFGFLFVLFGLFLIYRTLRKVKNIKDSNALLEKKVSERTKEATDALLSLKESQVQLVQAEKMSSVGQMVAGVTHEINTPLGYVKGNIQIIKSRIPYFSELVVMATKLSALTKLSQDDKIKSYSHELHDAVIAISENEIIEEMNNLSDESLDGILKISEIVTGLKDFSRIDRVQTTKFNVHDGLDSAIKIASHIIRGKEIIRKYEPNLPMVLCAPSSINQVFLNLINNAAQATGENGVITIKTFVRDTFVCIAVSDNGSGMSDEVKAKIFEPFFSTKPIGEGTGLGLSICQKIIQDHKGKILVESKQGFGTRFTIELPLPSLEVLSA